MRAQGLLPEARSPELYVAGLQRPDRQHDHLQPLELQAALNRHRRLVVKLAGQEVLLLEDELPGEEGGPPERAGDLHAELFDFLDGVRPEGVPILP